MPVASVRRARRRRLLVNFEDPVAQRLARLIAQEQDHPRLGTHEEMLRLRGYVMRDPDHSWHVCLSCDVPFYADHHDETTCDRCRLMFLAAFHANGTNGKTDHADE